MQDLQLELEEQNQTVDELNASLKDEISKKKKALSDLKGLDEDKREVCTTSLLKVFTIALPNITYHKD